MLPLCYRAPEREQFVCHLVANMRQTTPEVARKSIMIGDKQECLDTVARYQKAGFTALHLHALHAVLRGRDPGVRGGGHPRRPSV
jgi:hypothetical protein